MSDPKNDSSLHLEGIDEREFLVGEVPGRVDAKEVDAPLFLNVVVVARRVAERHRGKVVVNQAAEC